MNQTPVQNWSTKDVEKWILSFGESFASTAKTFGECAVDGAVLLTLTFDDLESTIGKGLKTRKIWLEIKRIQDQIHEKKKNSDSVPDKAPISANEAEKQDSSINQMEVDLPPRTAVGAQWSFYNKSAGWVQFPKESSDQVEKAWASRQDVTYGKWTLFLSKSYPFASRECLTRLLHREGGFGMEPPLKQKIDFHPTGPTWPVLASPTEVDPSRPVIKADVVLDPQVQMNLKMMNEIAKRRTFVALDPVVVFTTETCTEQIGIVPRHQIVNVTNISEGGIAMLSQPLQGYASLFNKHRSRKLLSRVFVVDAKLYQCKKPTRFASLTSALQGCQEAFENLQKANENICYSIHSASGQCIGVLGDGSSPSKTCVVVEEIHTNVNLYELAEMNLDTWASFIPELLVKRSTVNIAWNLFKDEASRSGAKRDDLNQIQSLFRLKRNEGTFSLSTAAVKTLKEVDCIELKSIAVAEATDPVPEQQSFEHQYSYNAKLLHYFNTTINKHRKKGKTWSVAFPASINSYQRKQFHMCAEEQNLKHESVGEGRDRRLFVYEGSGAKMMQKCEVKINRSMWIKKAQQLKRSGENLCRRTSLAHLNKVASTRQVGLLGPVGANIDRSLPRLITEEFLQNHVSKFKALEERADANYRLHRQFLRYADALTANLSNILEEEFDSEIVDTILMFFDNGCQDFIQNAKGSLAYSTTGSKCLDFYSGYQSNKKVVYNKTDTIVMSNGEISAGFLDGMWEEHPLTCLRLTFYLGAAREGKQDLAGFYVCMHWLFEKHPYTLLANIHLLNNVNYYKGMLEILDRILEDDEEQRGKRNQWYDETSKKYKKAEKDECGKVSSSFVNTLTKGKQCYNKTEIDFATNLLLRFDNDLIFRALHTRVAQVFAKSLLEDIQKKHNLTLAAKWCPTEGAKHDKHLLMHEAIARQCFPPKSDQREFEYQYSLQNRLRKELVSPLRKKTNVVERLLSTKQLGKINYEQVPGASMRKNEKSFRRLDGERFEKFLEDVAAGKAEVKAGSLTPVEIYMKMKECLRTNDKNGLTLINGQWNTMIAKLKKKIPKDQLDVVAAVDVSGSMSAATSVPGQRCIDVAIALGLVCISLGEGSYQGHLLMYTTVCKTIKIEGETLSEMYKSFEQQKFSGGTSYGPILQEVCDNLSVRGKFNFPGRIIILSDMEFHRGHNVSLNVAIGEYFTPTREVVAKKLGVDISEISTPEIVFWNIAAQSTPARKTDIGCSMISGHSAVVFKDVLCNAWSEMKRDVVTGQKQNDPLTVMLNALNKPLFQSLRVVKSKEEALDLLKEILLPTIQEAAI